MKKRTDHFDFILNLSILVLLGYFVDLCWFAPAEQKEILEKISTQNADPQPPSDPSSTPLQQSLSSAPLEKTTVLEKTETTPSFPLKKTLAFTEIEQEHRVHLQGRNVILVSKQEHLLFLMDSEGHAIGPFSIAIGKNPDRQPKQKEGDKRTPEGEYFISLVMDENHPTLQRWNSTPLRAQDGHHKYGKPSEDLGTQSYGPYFLMLNYPNSQDRKLGRTGSGIGIHGTNDPDSLGYDATSGCIRMKNEDLVWLAQWIKPGTSVKIVPSFSAMSQQ